MNQAPRAAKTKRLQPVRANLGVEAVYRKRLDALLDEMHNSLVYWISAAYKQNEPELRKLLAEDASPAKSLNEIYQELAKRWSARFTELATDLANYFSIQVSRRSDLALQGILKRAGFSVKFNRTRAVNDVLQATVHENVSLIKSIGQQHLAQVEGMVMRSVSAGRDLQSLQMGLEHQLGVSKRRAALIAKDQNNKATAVIQRTRQAELGIKEAIWVHSGGGKEPRPTHVRAGRDQVRYNISEGWFDPAEKKHVFPGELINCRCVARPVIPGLDL